MVIYLSIYQQLFQLPVKSSVDCGTFYKKHGKTLDSNQVCAGGVGVADKFISDSGGSLMVVDRGIFEENLFVYGVASFYSTSYGNENCPKIYTRVADYAEWIREHIKP